MITERTATTALALSVLVAAAVVVLPAVERLAHLFAALGGL